MIRLRIAAAAGLWVACFADVADARVWSDSTGQYTLEAKLIALNDKSVVLQRDDHELASISIEKLSDKDHEYLKSKEASDVARAVSEAAQTWTLRDGTKLVGRIVSYTTRDLTIQRRRGRIYVNDRVLDNVPEFYQLLIPKIVAQFENLPRADRRSLESWLIRQRGEPRTFHLEGVVLETESGDEYAVPFALLSEADLKVLKPGWEKWLAAYGDNNFGAEEDRTFLLRSLAAARYRDQLVQRDIAMMQLKLEAVQAGLTSLWEVTLYPAAGRGGPPLWVVVPGRDSRAATATALGQNPGHVAGPVRRVSGV